MSTRRPSTLDRVQILSSPLDVARSMVAIGCDHGTGAIVSFSGKVRDKNAGERDAITAMTIEHYPGMTERAINSIIDQASERWNLTEARVVHRSGTLYPGDAIVLVVVSCSHRKAAFAACEFIIDYLKTSAPFWKKEHTASTERWVQCKRSDADAARRWVAEEATLL